tara:strand:- start:90 stop:314 length:225 start_codon:yes stop_codon:yes gene_type:complete
MMDRLDTLAIFVEVAEQRAPRGLLSLTVPVVGEFFLKSYPEVRMRLLMLDRNVSRQARLLKCLTRSGPKMCRSM